MDTLMVWWEVAAPINGINEEIEPRKKFQTQAAAQAFIDVLATSVVDARGGRKAVRHNNITYFAGTSDQVDNWLQNLVPIQCYDDSLSELPRHLLNRPNWPPIPSGGAAPGTENLSV